MVVSLKEEFHEIFKFKYEEGHELSRDPYTHIIPGHGVKGKGIEVSIHSLDGETLAVYLYNRPRIKRTLLDMGYKMHQEGDREVTILIPRSHLLSLADTLGLHRYHKRPHLQGKPFPRRKEG